MTAQKKEPPHILIYCQHVVGVGHLCRMREIIRALAGFRVTLILGGPPAAISFPGFVDIIRLPGLMMDPQYTRMFPVDPALSLEQTKEARKKILLDLPGRLRPDLVLIELYPFGRGGFHFELEPFLRAIRTKAGHGCPVVCSLRDILVEKKDPIKYEHKVLKRLNSLFDALLVHGDPKVVPLDATFSRVADIAIPIHYTGYICQKPAPGSGDRLRRKLGLAPDEPLIVVSAGGGSFGHRLLEAALRAHARIPRPGPRLNLFSGPYLAEDRFKSLAALAAPGAVVERFSSDFPAWLAAANLSISMGGYNTTMNVLGAATPALIFPYTHDREQGLRARALRHLADLSVLSEDDLEPSRLAGLIRERLGSRPRTPRVKLNGAARTAAILNQFTESTVGPIRHEPHASP